MSALCRLNESALRWSSNAKALISSAMIQFSKVL